MDKRDLALLSTFPTKAVPYFGRREQNETPGDTVLVAANGMFVESVRKWGRFVRRISDAPSINLPYGECQEKSELSLPTLPSALIREFNDFAKANSHVEVGASIIWNEQSDTFRLAHSRTLHSTSDSLRQELPRLQDGEHLIVDCHSHSVHEAGFSNIDDESDRHAVQFSYVIGNCDLVHHSAAFRLCILGIFEKLDAFALQN